MVSTFESLPVGASTFLAATACFLDLLCRGEVFGGDLRGDVLRGDVRGEFREFDDFLGDDFLGDDFLGDVRGDRPRELDVDFDLDLDCERD